MDGLRDHRKNGPKRRWEHPTGPRLARLNDLFEATCPPRIVRKSGAMVLRTSPVSTQA